MQEKPSAIIFDLGGVILNLDYGKTIDAFKKLGKSDFESLYTQAQQTGVFDLLETGRIKPEEFYAHLKPLLQPNITSKEIDKAWNAMLLDLPAERLTLLKKLAAKYRIFLFSNTNEIHYKAFREIILEEHGNENILEEIFERTYYSHVLGMRKPHPESFEFILNQNGLEAKETLFVDDSIQHIEGAQSIGIKAIHLVDTTINELFKDF